MLYKALEDIKPLTITSFCTTKSFYDLFEKSAKKIFFRPTLRPNKYPKNLSKKNHLIHYCSQGNNKQLWFHAFLCNSLGTWRKMSFYQSGPKIIDFAPLPCSPRLTLEIHKV